MQGKRPSPQWAGVEEIAHSLPEDRDAEKGTQWDRHPPPSIKRAESVSASSQFAFDEPETRDRKPGGRGRGKRAAPQTSRPAARKERERIILSSSSMFEGFDMQEEAADSRGGVAEGCSLNESETRSFAPFRGLDKTGTKRTPPAEREDFKDSSFGGFAGFDLEEEEGEGGEKHGEAGEMHGGQGGIGASAVDWGSDRARADKEPVFTRGATPLAVGSSSVAAEARTAEGVNARDEREMRTKRGDGNGWDETSWSDVSWMEDNAEHEENTPATPTTPSTPSTTRLHDTGIGVYIAEKSEKQRDNPTGRGGEGKESSEDEAEVGESGVNEVTVSEGNDDDDGEWEEEEDRDGDKEEGEQHGKRARSESDSKTREKRSAEDLHISTSEASLKSTAQVLYGEGQRMVTLPQGTSRESLERERELVQELAVMSEKSAKAEADLAKAKEANQKLSSQLLALKVKHSVPLLRDCNFFLNYFLSWGRHLTHPVSYNLYRTPSKLTRTKWRRVTRSAT